MVYQAGALDETLAAAAGNDLELLADLRAAFMESLVSHVDHLRRARCDGNWIVAAERIKGLAASFGAQPLLDLAETALAAAPGEPTILRALAAFVDDCTPEA